MIPLPDAVTHENTRQVTGMRTGSPVDLLVLLLAETPDLSAVQDESLWATIKEHAGRYGVGPLVAWAARPHVTPVERAWCDRTLLQSWARHDRMLGHLEYALGLFACEGIPTIALKGPLLARRYYDPPFLRKPSVDLDIAVIEKDLGPACKALVKAGYKQDIPIGEALARSHHVGLSHASRARVELHFRLSHQSVGIPVNQFFERSISCRLPNGQEAQILGPADQLLHLILHLAHSRFGTLFHLCEIRRVYKAEPPAVRAEAIKRAVDHHFCGVLRMTDIAFRVRLGESFLPSDAAVPETWLNWRLNEKLYEAFESWAVPGRGLTLAARLQGRWLEFQLTDAPSDAIRTIRLLTHTARFQIARRGWGTAKNLAYVPTSGDTRR
jgi:Uncharacterised nucleotidyltransferase